MTTWPVLRGQRHEIGGVGRGCYPETGVPNGWCAALDAGCLAFLGEVGLGPLPLLVVPTTGSDGDRSGRRSVQGAEARRSAQHQLQRTSVQARERIGKYMDVYGWDGTRITQNLDFEVARGAAVR
jgi:hypothetical protein